MTNLSTKPLICFDIKEENGKIEILVPKKKRWYLNLGEHPLVLVPQCNNL
jgi:hypothetical protein